MLMLLLLLDELDSIAKRRDDARDVGELKHLVSVMLQKIGDWPASGLLICRDSVWRRFEMRAEFPMPTDAAVRQAIETFLGASKASAAG